MMTFLGAVALVAAGSVSAHATTFDVTPATAQTAATQATAGDTIVFGPGTYALGSAINLQSGVSYVGSPGAILTSTAGNNIMSGSNVSNVKIGGLTFENGPNVVDAAHAAIYLTNVNNVAVTGNGFQNIQGDAAVLFYQSDNLTINGNTGSGLREFVSGVNATNTAHSNVSVSNNTVSGVSRMGVEIQGAYSNLQVNTNTLTNAADAISVIDNSSNDTGVQVKGNTITGGTTAIEAGDANMTVTGNAVSGTTGGISIAKTPGGVFSGNTFSGVAIPVGPDGGNTGQGTIGQNTINSAQATTPSQGTLVMAQNTLTAAQSTGNAQSVQMQSGSAGGLNYQYLVGPGGCSTAAPCQIIEYLHYLGGESAVPSDLNQWFNTPAFWAAHPNTIVVAPQVNGSSDTNNWGGVQSGVSSNGQAAVAAVQQIEAQFATNPNTVVLTGGSMGGIGTEALMEEFGPKGTTGQHIYAAGLAFDGALYNSDPSTEKAALCGVPLTVQHGSADTTVNPGPDQQLAQALSGCAGFTYTEIPGAGHGTWGASYSALTQLSQTSAAASGGAAPVAQKALASTSSGLPPTTPTTASPGSQAATATPTTTATITPGSGSITDAAGNVWLITASGSIQENGQWVPGGGGTAALMIQNGVVYGEDANGKGWFTLSGNGQFWTQIQGAPPTAKLSAGTPIAPATTPPPSLLSTVAATPVMTCGSTTQGAFGVLNGKIYTPTQTVFMPRGINLYDNNMGSASQVLATFPGINFIRLNVYSYNSPSSYASFVSQMTAAGVVVEFEDHTSSDGGNYGGSIGSVFTGALLASELAWYAEMAKYYAGNPYVWFGTDNEPSESPSAAALSDWQLATYDAIRVAGGNKTAIIMVAMNCDKSGCGAGYNTSDYSNMTNVIWDMHYYGWITDYNASQSVVDAGLDAEVTSTQKITGAGGAIIPILVGEFGNSTNGTTVDQNGTQVVASVLKSGLGYAAWNWQSGAPADNLTDGGGSLSSPYGQQVAAGIKATAAADTNTGGGGSCSPTNVASAAAPTSTAAGGSVVVASEQGGGAAAAQTQQPTTDPATAVTNAAAAANASMQQTLQSTDAQIQQAEAANAANQPAQTPAETAAIAAQATANLQAAQAAMAGVKP